MKYLFIILFFISTQSFGQTVDVRVKADSTGGYSVSIGSILNIDTSIWHRSDTIFCTKIIRCQTNNNSSLLMTKVKYLIKRWVNGELVLTADDGKVYDVIKYYSAEYKTWISL